MTQVNLENGPSDRSQSWKATDCGIPFTWNVHNRQIHGDWNRLVVAMGWGDGEMGKSGVTTNGYGVSFGIDEKHSDIR